MTFLRSPDGPPDQQALNKVDDWTYKTKEQLEQECPTLRAGLEPKKIMLWRRQYVKIIRDAGVALRAPQWCISVAAMLCQRFFARKSMTRNDRYLIAQACLHLALKMEESPKSIRDVVKECLRVRLGKQSLKLKKALEPDEVEREKEETLVAERSVLYTLGFNLAITHPYRYLVQVLTALKLNESDKVEPRYKTFMQNAWNFLNDSMRTSLVLQYDPETLCLGALFTANLFNIHTQGSEGDIMHLVRKYTNNKDAQFFTAFNIKHVQAKDIAHQILEMYEETKTLDDERKGLLGHPRSTSLPGTAPQTPMIISPSPYTPSHASFQSSTPVNRPP